MPFHDATCKTRTTFKISTCFEDLSFLNPRSYLTSMIVAFAMSFFSLMTIFLSFPFSPFLFIEIFLFFFCFISLEEILLELLSKDVLLYDDVLILYELQDLLPFSSVQSVSYLLEYLISSVLRILSLIFVLTNVRIISQAPYWL